MSDHQTIKSDSDHPWKNIPALRHIDPPNIHPFIEREDWDTPKGFYLTERFWSRHGRRGPNT